MVSFVIGNVCNYVKKLVANKTNDTNVPKAFTSLFVFRAIAIRMFADR